MRHFLISPAEIGSSLWRHRYLVRTLIRQEVAGRYQGSVLGLLWSFFNPVFMLAVYTFVFSVIFKARWGTGGSDSKTEFALVLFVGMIIFNLFAECATRAPSLILSNLTYVKKVVFPLEILPWVNFGAALFHALVSLGVWLFFYVAVFGYPPDTIVLFPLLLLPLGLFSMGVSWFLASLGVYLRDVAQIAGIVTTALMFLTPIFYPISAIPASYQVVIRLNPFTSIIEQARNLLIFGRGMAWDEYGLLTLCAGFVAWLGFVWFQKTRKGFADVL